LVPGQTQPRQAAEPSAGQAPQVPPTTAARSAVAPGPGSTSP
jgi:hypothetical protein